MKGSAAATVAERRLISRRERYVTAVRESWRGSERELLISLVRALDVAAYAHNFATKGRDPYAWLRLRGGATALRPFLEAVRDMPGPIPWVPSNPALSPAFDNYLLACGGFATTIRLAAMERYGIASARISGEDRITIEVVSDAEERAEVAATHAANERASAAARALRPNLAAELPEVRRRLTRYGDAAMGWFIGYDNDQFLVDHYRSLAEIQASGTVEAEALPEAGLIGGRPFKEWRDASTAAFGGVLHHIDAVRRLRQRKPNLDLRNLLTVYARREDIIEVLMERGDDLPRARQLMTGLTLDAEGAADSEMRHEAPLSYYIDAGEHFVLLPMFGGLLNPHAGLLHYLRRNYRRDWDKIVDGREGVFRKELRHLLPEPRYRVLDTGLKLRRNDNSIITDADAIVLDRDTGDLVIVQLKWHDIYGFNIAERYSRQENLLTKGNEWVEKVCGWIDGRSSAEIAKTYGWGDAAAVAPRILVMARHSSKFAGETRYDSRASWTSWHTISEEIRDPSCAGFVAAIEKMQHRNLETGDPEGMSVFELPGMTVEIRSAKQG